MSGGSVGVGKVPKTQSPLGLYYAQARWKCPGTSPEARSTTLDGVILDHGMFQEFWHLLECCSCYVKSTELSQLWPLLAHQQGWIPSGYMLMSQYFPKGELSHLSHLCKDLCTLPRRICLCPYLVQHPAIAWGVSVLALCTWEVTLHRSACPWLFEPPAFQSLIYSRTYVDIFFSRALSTSP